jgi:hypothetical protein
VGFLVSLVVRKRWLSLAGLGIATAGIILGSLLKSGWLAGASILIGGALCLLQIPSGIRHDLRVMKGTEYKQKP